MTVLLGLATAVMWAFTDLTNVRMTRRAGEIACAFWLLAALLGFVVLHERMQRRQLIGIAVTLVGVAVLAVAQ